VPSGVNGDDFDGAVPLDGECHDDHLVHPASRMIRMSSRSCLLRPSSSAAASMRMVMAQDLSMMMKVATVTWSSPIPWLKA
jgi:hypothetical protein